MTITSSTDDSFSDLRTQEFPFSAIVKPQDKESFIHVPTDEADLIEASPLVGASLADVGVSVSTGPIVDFRTREHLRAMPEEGTVPLIYAFHIDGTKTTWPIEGAKKRTHWFETRAPNARYGRPATTLSCGGSRQRKKSAAWSPTSCSRRTSRGRSV